MFRPGRPLAAALLFLACSEPDPETVQEPYGGDAFPDGRATFELPAGDLGVVSNSGSDTLTLLDLDGSDIIGSAPVGLDPVEIDGPHHVAVDRGANVAFTALSYPPPTFVPGPHAAHGSSQRRGVVQKLALEDLAPIAQAQVDVNPGDVVLSADGTLLLVSHFDLRRVMLEKELEEQRADITILDAATLETVRSIRTCIAPHGIALSRPAAELAFVACYGEDALAVLDTTTGDAPELVSLGPGGLPGSPAYGPYAAVLSPGDETVAVSNTTSRDVRFFDVATREFRVNFATVPGEPYFPAWSADGARLFVPTQGTDALVVVDTESGELLDVKTFEPSECVRPHAAVFAADPQTLFLVCEGDHMSPSVVLAVNAATLEIEDTLAVGVYPDGLAVGGAP